jgi:hypothetical protein
MTDIACQSIADVTCQSIIFECGEPSTHAYFDATTKMVIYRCDKHQINYGGNITIVEINEIPFKDAALYEVMNS